MLLPPAAAAAAALQDLAAGGRSIATTIHQPSSRLYQKLDWLMLLAEGHLMYYGKADQVCVM
jgi:ABC-type multidrug transport system ATPase subunit